MEKMLALLLVFVTCLALCACGTTSDAAENAENTSNVVEDKNMSTDIIVQANEPTKLNDDITVTLLGYNVEGCHEQSIRKYGDDWCYGEDCTDAYIQAYFKIEYSGAGEMSLSTFGGATANETSSMPEFYLIRNNTKSKLYGMFLKEDGDFYSNDDSLLSGGESLCMVYISVTIPPEGVDGINVTECSIGVTIDDTNYYFMLANGINALDDDMVDDFYN